MNRKGSGLIVVLIIIVLALVVAGGIWFYKTRAPKATPPQSLTQNTEAQQPRIPSLGVIYKSYDYSNGYSGPQKISLYNFSAGQSEIIKGENEDFSSSTDLANWLDQNGNPIFLADYYDATVSTAEVYLFNASAPEEQSIFINKSSIVSDKSSIIFSSDYKEIGYCGPDGQYVVENLISEASASYTGTDICQVAYQGDLMFSRDNSAIYYQDVSTDETGADITGVAYKKLTLSTGNVTSVGNLVTSPFFNQDHTEFVEMFSNQLIVRKVDQFEKADLSNIETYPVVTIIKLPGDKSDQFQNAIFTEDGQGIFYTIRGSDGGYSLGYYDLSKDEQYPTTQIPGQNIWAIQLFAAFDMHSLVYGTWESQIYNGVEGQSNNIDLYNGSADAQPRLIDRANWFDILSFVRSE